MRVKHLKKIFATLMAVAGLLLITGRLRRLTPKSTFFATTATNLPTPHTTPSKPLQDILTGDTKRLGHANHALPWLSHELIPRLISRQEHDRCIELLAQVDAILSKFNITYMLAYGTLLGSYVMHDMLPWDDDIDIFMNIDDRPNIKRLFNGNGSGHYDQIRYTETRNKYALTGKLYSLADPKAGKYKWHWPFIDISFYREKGSQLLTYQNTKDLTMKRADFFPLTQRPLAWRWFPAPRNTKAFIELKYKQFVCKSHNWDHKNEISLKKRYFVDCAKIISHYPFVARPTLVNEKQELLILHGKLIYSTSIN